MGIIEVISRHFDPEKVNLHARIEKDGLIWPNNYTEIREGLSEKQKIITLIHELLHLDARYKNPLVKKGSKEFWKSFMKMPISDPAKAYPFHSLPANIIQRKLEISVENEALQIYNCQPRLVEYLKHQLKLQSYSWVQKIIDKARGQQYIFEV